MWCGQCDPSTQYGTLSSQCIHWPTRWRRVTSPWLTATAFNFPTQQNSQNHCAIIRPAFTSCHCRQNLLRPRTKLQEMTAVIGTTRPKEASITLLRRACGKFGITSCSLHPDNQLCPNLRAFVMFELCNLKLMLQRCHWGLW